MNTSITTELSEELQESFLENKQWLSDIAFLEDELRFFQKLFGSILFKIKGEQLDQEVEFINTRLSELEKKRTALKAMAIHHKGIIEELVKDPSQPITLYFIDENSRISRDIKALFTEDTTVKKELYKLVEQVIPA